MQITGVIKQAKLCPSLPNFGVEIIQCNLLFVVVHLAVVVQASYSH